ncbi:hypothetical protein HGM15179_018486 [Zosterops borbonicus]|uniref:Ig-like domain-containing protein n=1 Tax=Zosterops borbonicus TaxID=364589 RepID=A0A8K1FYY4_9PASS|nr:hypothetical protein HGM15179_018486 [Zosterops borbonicus]
MAGWCPLSPTGAQTTQILVEPSWRPAVLWDQVTLTCQGWGTATANTWYKDRKRWQKGPNSFTVTTSGMYQCDRPGTGLSPHIHILNAAAQWQLPLQGLGELWAITILGDVSTSDSDSTWAPSEEVTGLDPHIVDTEWAGGAQTTKLLVEPPWRPAVLWDRVTLTCQVWGTAGATTWHKNRERWGKEVQDKFVVTKSGTYTCDRPRTTLSPP